MGVAQKSVPPSLRHGAGESRLLPRSMTPPGDLGKGTRGGPPSASVLEDLERAETSASLKPRRALLSIPPPEFGRVVPCTSLAQLLPSSSAQLKRVFPEAPRGPPGPPVRTHRGDAFTCAPVGCGVTDPVRLSL